MTSQIRGSKNAWRRVATVVVMPHQAVLLVVRVPRPQCVGPGAHLGQSQFQGCDDEAQPGPGDQQPKKKMRMFGIDGNGVLLEYHMCIYIYIHMYIYIYNGCVHKLSYRPNNDDLSIKQWD